MPLFLDDGQHLTAGGHLRPGGLKAFGHQPCLIPAVALHVKDRQRIKVVRIVRLHTKGALQGAFGFIVAFDFLQKKSQVVLNPRTLWQAGGCIAQEDYRVIQLVFSRPATDPVSI